MFRHPIAKVSEIGEAPKRFDFFGRSVHVALVGGEVVAFADACLHLGGPLEFKDGRFVCSWHGACFDARGARESGPAPAGSRLMRVPVEVVGDVVEYVWSG